MLPVCYRMGCTKLVGIRQACLCRPRDFPLHLKDGTIVTKLSFAMRKLSLKVLIPGLLIACMAGAAFAPKDDKPFKAQNLKVLPQDISKDSLMAIMHNWEDALGVGCDYCHAPRKDDPKKLDFASDEIRKKEFARHMYVMTDSINKQYFAWWPEHNTTRPAAVTCYTCHKGRAEPVAIAPEKKEKK